MPRRSWADIDSTRVWKARGECFARREQGERLQTEYPPYVETIIEEETLTLGEAMENLKQALDEAYAAEDRFR